MRGKAVLDVGCGTGVLSMLCARAGARVVYAVEASGMATAARRIVEANGLSHVVQVHQGLVEDVVLPEKVDVLVSEWMGFYLLNEGMLDSVLAARDAHLKAGGVLLPPVARLLLAPVQLDRSELDFWKSPVEGFDMRALVDAADAEAQGSPLLTPLPPGALLCAPVVVATLDVATVQSAQLDCVELRAQCVVNAGVDGVCVWFDCPPFLDTSPAAPPTHWGQTTLRVGARRGGRANQPLEVELVLVRMQGRSYEALLHVAGYDGHEVECECVTCQVVRGTTFGAAPE